MASNLCLIKMEARRAIVREPGLSYKECISTHPLHHSLDLELAKKQHRAYCKILEDLSIELIKLPAKDKYPDSCFVEDNAIISEKKAFVTRMAMKSRRGEEDDVEAILKKYFKTRKAKTPATIEGGDVIHLPNRLICGLTQRTNLEGVKQLREWFDVQIDTIANSEIVHLKSYMKYLGNGKIITTEDYENHPLLKGLELLIVPKEEYYSVNCLAVKNTVVMSKKFSYASKIVRDAGFEVINLEMSEFEKCQASLTCLSILF